MIQQPTFYITFVMLAALSLLGGSLIRLYWKNANLSLSLNKTRAFIAKAEEERQRLLEENDSAYGRIVADREKYYALYIEGQEELYKRAGEYNEVRAELSQAKKLNKVLEDKAASLTNRLFGDFDISGKSDTFTITNSDRRSAKGLFKLPNVQYKTAKVLEFNYAFDEYSRLTMGKVSNELAASVIINTLSRSIAEQIIQHPDLVDLSVEYNHMRRERVYTGRVTLYI